MFRFFICCIIILGFVFQSPVLSAQMSTAEALELIKAEGLVVRINANQAKRNKLSQLINKGDIKDETREKLIQRRYVLDTTYTFRTKAIQEMFEAAYNYSDVYFVPDSLFESFIDGNRENVFLDDSLSLFSNDRIGENFVFVYNPYGNFRKFEVRRSEYEREIADYKRVEPPMKHSIRVFNIGKLFKFLAGKLDDPYQIKEPIMSLNEMLHKLDRAN